ncbi:MAG: polysaccharide pyruvyl transferase family protein [Pseudonocardiaceae bacterium]
MRKRAPARITLLTQTPATDAALLAPHDVETRADPFVVSSAWSERHTRPQPTVPDPQELLSSADLLIATGGDLYTSDYGVSTAYLAAPAHAIRAGVAVGMLAHSIGPFARSDDASAWTSVARDCMVLTTRETLSHRYVIDELGVPDTHAALAADPAFLLPTAPADRVEQILRALGIGPADSYLCLAPSQGIASFRRLGERAHEQALGRLIGHLTSRWPEPVLLIPHVHDSRPHNDDRRLVTRLSARFTHLGARAVPGPLTASEYKGITAGARLLIAERLHAAIGGLSSNTPTAAIGYSPKFAGVLADTYADPDALDTTHLEVDTFVHDDFAPARLVGCLDIDALSEALCSRLPLIQQRAESNFTALPTPPREQVAG